MPKIKQTQRRAIVRGPNHVAIVLFIEVGSESILLGSDLEETTDPLTGWSVIVASRARPQKRAQVFKIPHHGSVTAHNDDVWTLMVQDQAYAVMTPFIKGKVSLPTQTDLSRIKGRSAQTYVTSASKKTQPIKRSNEVQRTISNTVRGTLTVRELPTGFVRLRRKFGPTGRWYVHMGENALKVT